VHVEEKAIPNQTYADRHKRHLLA